jgi:transposase
LFRILSRCFGFYANIQNFVAQVSRADADGRPSPVALLARLKAIGPQIGPVLYHEGLYRSFANRRDVAAYPGIAPKPIAREPRLFAKGSDAVVAAFSAA